MSKYRLLALDLDDTLLTNDKRISSRTKYWIYEAIKKGLIVSFATGRGLQRVDSVLKELSIKPPMVLVNGAEVWKNPDHLLERHYINTDDIMILYNLAIKENAQFWAYGVDDLVTSLEWSNEMFNDNWMKFGIRSKDQTALRRIWEELTHNKNLEITSSASTNIEVTCNGITKETGIKKLCKSLNVGMDEVIAIGDNLNDLDLLKSAGLGIAMGNAHEDLKKISDGITSSNEEDGVAQAIVKYIFEKEEFKCVKV